MTDQTPPDWVLIEAAKRSDWYLMDGATQLRPAYKTNSSFRALCRAIEQHEQFKREVSDAVTAFFEAGGFDATKGLVRFILLKPVDPLECVLQDAGYAVFPEDLSKVHAAIEARGGKIVWENEP